MPAFTPRPVFEVSSSLVRSYFLGHHNAALRSMREMIQNVGLVLECRDSRVPLTSTNPLLESALAGRDRIIVYTKSDLCSDIKSHRWKEKRLSLMTQWVSHTPQGFLAARAAENKEPELDSEDVTLEDLFSKTGAKEADDDPQGGEAVENASDSLAPPTDLIRGPGGGRTQVIYTSKDKPSTTRALLAAIKKIAVDHDSIMGLRALVVGMPNVGKSTLLNELRYVGMRSPNALKDAPKVHKAAKTGGQPGITRKFSTPVRIIAKSTSTPTDASSTSSQADVGEGVFLVDTPGVFIPYAPSVEAMLKLALVGCVADTDTIIPHEIKADYLLFLLNLRDPRLYSHLSPPTNDIHEFLENAARRTGKLSKGGDFSRETTANWLVQRYREGMFGRFGLDDISEKALVAHAQRLVDQGVEGEAAPLSLSQARKRQKAARKAASTAKRAAAKDSAGASF